MPQTVLIVETDPAVRRLLQAALLRRGLTTRETDTGPDAVARLAADPAGIGAVIAGELVPGLDGPDLVAALTGVSRDVGLFFFCGGSLPPDMFDLPGVEVFLKPHGLGDLCRAVAARLAAGPESPGTGPENTRPDQ